jgi:hypothetical protein
VWRGAVRQGGHGMVRRGLLRSDAERQGRSRRSRTRCGMERYGAVSRDAVRRGGLGVERSGKSWLGRAVTGYKGESDEVYEKNASRAY